MFLHSLRDGIFALTLLLVSWIDSFCLPAQQYPKEIHKYDYIPNFTVRGLHYDIQKVLCLFWITNVPLKKWFHSSVPIITSESLCRVFWWRSMPSITYSRERCTGKTLLLCWVCLLFDHITCVFIFWYTSLLVCRGLSPVPDEEVLELFGGTYHVPLELDSGFYGKVRRFY